MRACIDRKPIAVVLFKETLPKVSGYLFWRGCAVLYRSNYSFRIRLCVSTYSEDQAHSQIFYNTHDAHTIGTSVFLTLDQHIPRTSEPQHLEFPIGVFKVNLFSLLPAGVLSFLIICVCRWVSVLVVLSVASQLAVSATTYSFVVYWFAVYSACIWYRSTDVWSWVSSMLNYLTKFDACCLDLALLPAAVDTS